MHLPAPLRAAVGLLATARDEARHLPDRAIELPMLAISTALQASLRAQQRYARLAARGDEVLNRRPPSSEPPPWATFDDPVEPAGPASNETLFAPADYVPADLEEVDRQPGTTDEQVSGPPAATRPLAATKQGPTKQRVTKQAPTKQGVKKQAKKQAAEQEAGITAKPGKDATKAPKKKQAANGADKAASGKTISKPRHTAPSAFDNVTDHVSDSVAHNRADNIRDDTADDAG